MRRLCTEGTHLSVVTLCVLFGKTKQAYYKHDDNRALEYLAKENFILEYVKEVRRKDRGIGGEKLWYMYRLCFGDEHAVPYERPHMSLDMMTPAQAATKSGMLNKKWVSYREKYLVNNQV